MKAAVALAAVLLLTVGGLGVGPSGAQPAEPTLQIAESEVAPGGSLTVTGMCPAGREARLHGHLVVGEDDEQGFSGSLSPSTATDGSFAVAFPIPREIRSGIWRLHLSCTVQDAVLAGPSREVEVQAVSPEPLTAMLSPDPQVGGRVTATGTGCMANGQALGHVIASVGTSGPTFGGQPGPTFAGGGEATSKPDGTWSVSFDIPDDFPAGVSHLRVECSNASVQGVSWDRLLQRKVLVLPSDGTTATTVRGRELPRTGATSPWGLTAAAAALFSGGATALVASRRRRGTAALS